MSLKGRIDADLKTALLGRDALATELLRGLKAAILSEEIAKGKREEGLSDDAVEQVLAREAKKRDESAVMFDQGGKPELAEKERSEKALIQGYLPQQLTEAELATLVDETITALGVSGPQAMGQVIGAVKAKVGQAGDGATIARLVKEKL